MENWKLRGHKLAITSSIVLCVVFYMLLAKLVSDHFKVCRFMVSCLPMAMLTKLVGESFSGPCYIWVVWSLVTLFHGLLMVQCRIIHALTYGPFLIRLIKSMCCFWNLEMPKSLLHLSRRFFENNITTFMR